MSISRDLRFPRYMYPALDVAVAVVVADAEQRGGGDLEVPVSVSASLQPPDDCGGPKVHCGSKKKLQTKMVKQMSR